MCLRCSLSSSLCVSPLPATPSATPTRKNSLTPGSPRSPFPHDSRTTLRRSKLFGAEKTTATSLSRSSSAHADSTEVVDDEDADVALATLAGSINVVLSPGRTKEVRFLVLSHE